MPKILNEYPKCGGEYILNGFAFNCKGRVMTDLNTGRPFCTTTAQPPGHGKGSLFGRKKK